MRYLLLFGLAPSRYCLVSDGIVEVRAWARWYYALLTIHPMFQDVGVTLFQAFIRPDLEPFRLVGDPG